MRSGALPLRLLVSFLFVIVNFTNGGNLELYQDGGPEPPKEMVYKRIARYLGSQNRDQREMRRSRMPVILPWQYSDYLDYRRHREKKLLEALLDNPSLIDVLENRKLKDPEEVVQHWSQRYDNLEDNSRGEGRNGPFAGADSAPPIFDDYNKPNGYTKHLFDDENPYYARSPNYPLRFYPPENENYPADDAELLSKLQGRFIETNENRASSEEEKPRWQLDDTATWESSSRKSEHEPEFTFKFDQPRINEHGAFAVRPNDPRYYEDDGATTPLVEDEATTSEREEATEPSEKIDDPGEESDDERKSDDYDAPNIVREDKFSLMKFSMPELRRRVERDPFVVTSSRMMNNDIYFIAIVAGCSAACMFALVLIALTWCRLQRGAKAAADIEYPAYGVTGPNKDVSPSGDQRLAHSAQMYHFQHQKQQIIAMESRTAASRDPGSVSEAESDEENEEGDYTVYECPGLASTGEMEVKNPMFHDDPTPATPPQIHKEEDHI